jgi:hypothetical protein
MNRYYGTLMFVFFCSASSMEEQNQSALNRAALSIEKKEKVIAVLKKWEICVRYAPGGRLEEWLKKHSLAIEIPPTTP